MRKTGFFALTVMLAISLAVPSGGARAAATPTYVVAKDGSGQYKSVQAAVNAVPANNKKRVIIYIKKGTYKEVVTIPANKPYISLIGESGTDTIITYDNYAGKVKSDGSKYGTNGSATMFINGNDFTAENLTISNSFNESSTADKDKQAVAALVQGDRAIFKNVRLLGNQDTLWDHKGRHYYYKCYIEGDVDFIFGAGQAVFDDTDIYSLSRGSSINNGYITAASTPITQQYGFLFINSRLKSNAPKGTVYLGRPWHPGGDSNAIGSVVYKNCDLGAHIHSEGWTDMSGFKASDARFYEYKNYGNGANTNRRQLTDNDAANYTVYNVLKGSDNWNPQNFTY